MTPQVTRAWPRELPWPAGCSQMRYRQKPEKGLCIESSGPEAPSLPWEGHAWAGLLGDEEQTEQSWAISPSRPESTWVPRQQADGARPERRAAWPTVLLLASFWGGGCLLHTLLQQ